MRRLTIVAVLTLTVLGLLAGLALLDRSTVTDSGSKSVWEGLALSMRPALAAPTASFLDTEAGIGGYAQVTWTASTSATVWSNVKAQLQTIEKEGSDYVIGTFALTDYAPRWDPHVYIGKDGWVVVYWPKDETPAILFDIKAGFGKTHVDRAMAAIAAAGGVPKPSVSYYDFAHPTANRIITASLPTTASGEASFSVTLPSGVAMLAAGWVFWSGGGGTSCRSEGLFSYGYGGTLSVGSTRLACGNAIEPVRNAVSPEIGILTTASVPVGTETSFRVLQEAGNTYTSIVLVVREEQ